MKSVVVIFGNLKVAQTYRLPNWMSTAIEVSLRTSPSWIRILVRSLKNRASSSFSYPSFRTLFHIVYNRSRLVTSLEHIQCTHLWNGLWSVLHTVLRSRNVFWRYGDWSTDLLEGKCSFHKFPKISLLLCCQEIDFHTNFFFINSFRVSRRGNVFFSLLFSLIDILITLVGSMQEPS